MVDKKFLKELEDLEDSGGVTATSKPVPKSVTALPKVPPEQTPSKKSSGT